MSTRVSTPRIHASTKIRPFPESLPPMTHRCSIDDSSSAQICTTGRGTRSRCFHLSGRSRESPASVGSLTSCKKDLTPSVLPPEPVGQPLELQSLTATTSGGNAFPFFLHDLGPYCFRHLRKTSTGDASPALPSSPRSLWMSRKARG